MIVGDDVAVRTDDHSRTAALALPLLETFVTEEEAEERIDLLLALLRSYGHFNINNCIHGIFGRICKIRVIGE